MSIYTVQLKERKEIADGTMAFSFNKPAGFEFVAGQSIDLTLLNPSETDTKGPMRTLSLASAPSESELLVATRMRDTAFKRELKKLPLEASFQMEGPFGFMTLPKKTARPAVFLAGGIGITPFRSMLCQAAATQASHSLFLFYSNRRPEDAAFLAELAELSAQNPNFTLVATMTHPENSRIHWKGETGFINKELLEKFVGDLKQPVYYIAGPSSMESAMRDLLLDLGVEEGDINSEGFAGY
jgi:ferredoxin-NADP reductase